MNIIFHNPTNDLQKDFLTIHVNEHNSKNIEAGLAQLCEQNYQKGYKVEDVKQSILIFLTKEQPNVDAINIDQITLRTDNQHFSLENDGLTNITISLLALASIELNTLGKNLIDFNKSILTPFNNKSV